MKSTKSNCGPTTQAVLMNNLAAALSDTLMTLPGLRWAMHRAYTDLFEMDLPQYFEDWNSWRDGRTSDVRFLTRNIYVRDLSKWRTLKQDDEGWDLLCIVDMALALVEATDGIDPHAKWDSDPSREQKVVRRLRIARLEFTAYTDKPYHSTADYQEYTALAVRDSAQSGDSQEHSAPESEDMAPQAELTWELLPYVKSERK